MIWSVHEARKLSITLIEGIRVGHSTDVSSATGCTAVICDRDAVAGVDVRGGATASHELELLDPCGLVEKVQGIILAGGSAMGLASVHGAVDYFRKQKRGFPTQQGTVPIVPAASIYDLGIGDPAAFPTASDGRSACDSAGVDFARGSVGAGTGAVVGKILGHLDATKGGLGSAGWETSDGLQIGVIATVNAFGDVLDPDTREIIAGARNESGTAFDSVSAIINGDISPIRFGTNTTLCVVATNAKLDKTQATIVARIAQLGLSHAVSPCHTQYDGDMVFVLSMGDHECDLNRVGVLASRVIEAAVVDAVLQATPLHGIPCANDLGWYRDANPGTGS